MNEIVSKLNKITSVKTELKEALEEKGVVVEDNLPFDQYPSKVKEIQAGVEGDEITLGLDMSDGDQVLIAPDNTAYSKVTINKPDTLLPENIAEGVEIGGVTGTLVPTTNNITVESSAIDNVLNGRMLNYFSGLNFSKDFTNPKEYTGDALWAYMEGNNKRYISPYAFAGTQINAYRPSSENVLTIPSSIKYIAAHAFLQARISKFRKLRATNIGGIDMSALIEAGTNYDNTSDYDYNLHEIELTFNPENNHGHGGYCYYPFTNSYYYINKNIEKITLTNIFYMTGTINVPASSTLKEVNIDTEILDTSLFKVNNSTALNSLETLNISDRLSIFYSSIANNVPTSFIKTKNGGNYLSSITQEHAFFTKTNSSYCIITDPCKLSNDPFKAGDHIFIGKDVITTNVNKSGYYSDEVDEKGNYMFHNIYNGGTDYSGVTFRSSYIQPAEIIFEEGYDGPDLPADVITKDGHLKTYQVCLPDGTLVTEYTGYWFMLTNKDITSPDETKPYVIGLYTDAELTTKVTPNTYYEQDTIYVEITSEFITRDGLTVETAWEINPGKTVDEKFTGDNWTERLYAYYWIPASTEDRSLRYDFELLSDNFDGGSSVWNIDTEAKIYDNDDNSKYGNNSPGQNIDLPANAGGYIIRYSHYSNRNSKPMANYNTSSSGGYVTTVYVRLHLTTR